jgi:hypothetical protein
MAEKKVREVKPMIMGRRKVNIPHYDNGGAVTTGGGGLFGTIGSGIQSFAGDLTNQNQFNATLAPTTQTDYSGVVGQAGQNALSGYGNFNTNQGQQQNLANALQSVSNGSGPNPAQAMLSQATGANVANQAALIAGQRGAGANVGLQARQAAMAGSNAQQQAAGQAATLQSQQQLNALNAQGAVLGQMGNQNIAEQGANTNLFSGAAGAQNAQNTGNIQNYGMAEGLNQKTSQSNTDAVNKTTGGFLNGIGGAATALIGLAKGGQVPDHFAKVHALYHADENPKLAMVPKSARFADGGAVPVSTATMTNTATATSTNTALSSEQRKAKEQKLKDTMDPDSTAMIGYADGGDVFAPDYKGVQAKIGNWATDGQSDLQMKAAKSVAQNGGESAMLPADVKGTQAVNDYRSGGRVGGRAMVAGNSLKNDTQPAMLSPKEIVLPRSITMAPDAPEQAAKFVAAILKKQGHGNSTHHKEFHKALKEAILSRKK